MVDSALPPTGPWVAQLALENRKLPQEAPPLWCMTCLWLLRAPAQTGPWHVVAPGPWETLLALESPTLPQEASLLGFSERLWR